MEQALSAEGRSLMPASARANARYLEGLAAVAASEGRVVAAAHLWGAAEAMLEKIEVGVHTYVPDRSLRQSQISGARAQLGEEAFAAAWAEGRAMTSEQDIEHALGPSTTS